MRKHFTLISLLLSCLTLSAQQLQGTYKNKNDSIVFSDDKVSFRLTGFAGLSTVQVGTGNYQVNEDFLLVHTKDYPGTKTTYESLDTSRSDTCIVRVISLNNYPVQGILVEYKNRSNKVLGAGVTGSDGRVVITDYDKVSKLTVSDMGYSPITIDFNPGYDYVVRIVDSQIIENKTVAFKFDKIDSETISLLLLTDNLDSGKDLNKELGKLTKRAERTNLIGKRYTKESPIFIR